MRSRYKQRILDIVATDASPEKLAERIDFIYAQIRDAAHDDPNKGFTSAEFDDACERLRNRIAERTESLLEQASRP